MRTRSLLTVLAISPLLTSQIALAEITIAPGDSISVGGQRVTCSPGGSGGGAQDRGGVIAPLGCAGQESTFVSINVTLTSGKQLDGTPGLGNVASMEFCRKVASAFQKYAGTFMGPKKYRYCAQERQMQWQGKIPGGRWVYTPNPSAPSHLYDCLITPGNQSLICTPISSHSSIDNCVSDM